MRPSFFVAFFCSLAVGSLMEGCTAAVVAASMAGTSALTNTVVDNQMSDVHKISAMNCYELRKEWAKTEQNKLGVFSMFGGWESKREAIRSTAQVKHCRI